MTPQDTGLPCCVKRAVTHGQAFAHDNDCPYILTEARALLEEVAVDGDLKEMVSPLPPHPKSRAWGKIAFTDIILRYRILPPDELSLFCQTVLRGLAK